MCVPAGLEQPVALAQRNLQRFGEHEKRLATSLRPTRFDEAHMASREPVAARDGMSHFYLVIRHHIRGWPISRSADGKAAAGAYAAAVRYDDELGGGKGFRRWRWICID